MQSLSVSNLQVLEIDDNNNAPEYVKHVNNRQKRFSRFIKANVYYSQHSHLNLNQRFQMRFNFGKNDKNLNNNKVKQMLRRNDSGYLSAASAETIFSIDGGNYASYGSLSQKDRELMGSTASLFDRSPVDMSDVFGLRFSNSVKNRKNNKRKNSFDETKNPSLNLSKEYSVKNIPSGGHTTYGNRSWDEIAVLSDVALNQWLCSRERSKPKVNTVSEMSGKTYAYIEPNSKAKNSLLLNEALLYLPLRRHTSELNLRKLISDSGELFSDDMQLDGTLVANEDDIRELKRNTGDDSQWESESERAARDEITDDIYHLFMDMHELRLDDEHLEALAAKITKIDKYLLSHIQCRDVANYLFSKRCCGCRLLSLCSVIQFGQALTQIAVDCIAGKTAVYQRTAYIIAIIKLSICLYRASNWQSLNIMVSALHAYKIYRLNSEWHQIKRNHRYYYDEFVKLTAIIRSSETSLMYAIPKGIPTLKSLLLAERVNCLSKWDRMERPAKWLQQPGIIDWLEREFKYNLIITDNVNSDRNRGMDEWAKSDGKHNHKQMICFIPLKKMPDNWLNRSTKNIPLEYRHRIVEFLTKSLTNALRF